MRTTVFVAVKCLALASVCQFWLMRASAQEGDLAARTNALATALEKFDSNVLPTGESLREMLPSDLSRRLKEANQKSTAEWRAIQSRAEWERFRDEKIGKLRASLNLPPGEKVPLKVQVTGELAEDGYVIRKIIYDSRPNWQVTANLYLPAKIPAKMPGILLSHSHHSPKSQGELQDVGAIWARAGCAVLVPDQLGHGERRQHPFVSAADFPEKFQASRQDYYFRYNTSMQLYVCGESLMGWMAWDLMRGLDVLETFPSIDRERIALMGGVAGGGDPAGVTAALDPRVKLLVPFNFGGPQPETKYPLPDNAEETFNDAGSGSWESTRNLHLSARDGFLPWVIVGSIAPRGLIHAHEFAWDRERDPVWNRYEKIYEFYDAKDKLDFTHGYGNVKLSESEASHCGNIGKHHRQRIHEYLAKHWGLAVDESQPINRHPVAELACLSDGMRLTPLHTVLTQHDKEHSKSWKDVLGNVEPYAVKAELKGREEFSGIVGERYVLSGERDIQLPALLLLPADRARVQKVTVCVAHAGKEAFLKHASTTLASDLIDSAVCLVDVRGTGESRPDHDRGRRSYATSLAASELMLGEPRLTGQLRDLRSALAWLRSEQKFDEVALWGESFSPPTPEQANVARPLELNQPGICEPTGPTLVILAATMESHVAGGRTSGGLHSYASLLESQFLHVPLDAIVPGALLAGDLSRTADQVQQKHLIRHSNTVNGRNQPLGVPR